MVKDSHIDYKRELETASRRMIMVHEPQLLIKLILRMIVAKLKVKHAGMLTYHRQKDTFILNLSRGERGLKIPAGFARFDKEQPLIKLFLDQEYRSLLLNHSAILIQDVAKFIWHESLLSGKNGQQNLLHQVGEQMRAFNIEACVPVRYKDKLLAILLLGQKESGELFGREELDFFSALASDVAMAMLNAQLIEDLKKESDRNRNLFLGTIAALGSAIEHKDKYTHGHTKRVTEFSTLIAKQMRTTGVYVFPDNFFENLYVAAILHDIGKIGVPEAVLNKEGTLSDEEMILMKKHPLFGAEILKIISELSQCLDGIKYHHERYDGKGYPFGLKGDDIPMIAAIITVADAFDAMTTDRPYRRALTRDEAIREIRKNVGVQFHPLPAKALLDLLEMGRI